MENKFINVNEAYAHHDLACWYQSSVDDTPPIWTDEHLEELLNDFYVIPKDAHTTDVVSRAEVEKIFDDIDGCVIGILEPSFQELRKKYIGG